MGGEGREGIDTVACLSTISVEKQPDGSGSGYFSNIANQVPIKLPCGQAIVGAVVGRIVQHLTLKQGNDYE